MTTLTCLPARAHCGAAAAAVRAHLYVDAPFPAFGMNYLVSVTPLVVSVVPVGSVDSWSLPLAMTAAPTAEVAVAAVPSGVAQEPILRISETYPAPTLVDGRPA